MIVRNEEANLRPCLEPVRSLVHEMIVVDTGSTDRTREVAAELGARVFEFHWCDDFAAARNESLRHATGEWVFWLDADDRVEGPQVGRLAELFSKLGDEPRAYMMNCICLPQNAVDPARVLPHCRLFRRHPDVRWRRRVHEQILDGIERLNHPLVVTDIQIAHLGYRDSALVRRKANRDLRLLRMEYATDPTDPVTLYNLGLVHARIGQIGESLTYLLSALKHVTNFRDWVSELYCLISDLLGQMGRHEESLAILGDGLVRFPLDPGLMTRRGKLLLQLGDLGGAERCLLQLVRSPVRTFLVPCERSVLDRQEAREILAMIYREQGRFEEAERTYQELLAQHPQSVAAWVGLGYVGLARKQIGDVEYVARQLEKCPSGAAYAAVMRAEGKMAHGDMEPARELINRAIELAPLMLWPRLALANWLAQTGAPVVAQVAAHRDILRMDPANVQAKAQLDLLLPREGKKMESPGLWFTITT